MTDLKLYCTIATQPVVETLIPRFETEHGCRFDVVWNTAPVLVKRLQSGEHGDVLLLNRAGSETMAAAGRLIDGSQTPIAGFLPGELHMVTHFVAGIEKQSPHADLAKAFIEALRTPEARTAFAGKGLDPA